MSDETTLFDKIIRGDIPSHKVYEDQHVLAFLDIAPLSPGHTLTAQADAADGTCGLPAPPTTSRRGYGPRSSRG